MNIDAFVEQLAEAAPRQSDLEKCGLSSEEAKDFVNSFLAVKYGQRPDSTVGSDCSVETSDWDLSPLEIGMVRFLGRPERVSGGVRIGCVEADPLVARPGCGEIVVEELGAPTRVLWCVAKNVPHMLDALIVAARFLVCRVVGTIDPDDHAAARSSALQCAFAAGGDEYLDFYKMLLGAQ